MAPDKPHANAGAGDGADLLELTRTLLDAIARGDWVAYATHCDPGITCFEPEARGERVAGLDFHRFYFRGRREAGAAGATQTTMLTPHVWHLGPDVGVVSYVRLVQAHDAQGGYHSTRHEETRVWHRRDGRWLLVHLHRSANP
jgi:calcium/calmodulin-dependent protein kinase (CaM kinase) II